MRNTKIGDLIEIETNKGFAYAQFTHKHRSYGHLIRVVDGLFESRQDDVTELALRPTKFAVFFPLGVAIKRGLVRLVGNTTIPESDRRFPIFRSSLADRTHPATVWWLWDGESNKEWRVDKLTPEQRKLPILEVVNDTMLKLAIENDWRMEDRD